MSQKKEPLPNVEADVILTEATFCDSGKMKSDLKGPEEDCRAFVMLAVRDRTNTDVTS